MKDISPCATCPKSGTSGFCAAIFESTVPAESTGKSDWQHHLVVPAGRQLLTANQTSPDIYVFCAGWGFRFLQMPNGRRQILGFLLPGDVLVGSLLHERLHFSVKALTAIQVSTMKRTEVQARIAMNVHILWAAAECCANEVRTADETIAALGQFSAEERIAHLFLQLMKRIASRNVIRDERYRVPLRQQHIADAVGLTPVHVSRVLSTFRERRLADLSNGVLEVFDLRELQRLGALS
ncbi:Crp/Fnr family transcriptional regulator [Bradyrhizobium cosmicum]|uniref:Crp/Fnr family transcriptional regulator n=1 Tax=Bradyrhizobium cosmicum TaxID=1404864 RepID=UPI0002F147CE|nr:Crp/Fnr family transcriptional regulator [Bradyrhizobium cosmicum]